MSVGFSLVDLRGLLAIGWAGPSTNSMVLSDDPLPTPNSSCLLVVSWRQAVVSRGLNIHLVSKK